MVAQNVLTQQGLEIKTIRSSDANCYLLKADTGYLLIDTGYPTTRTELIEALESAGCKPGGLKLILKPFPMEQFVRKNR